MGKVEQKKKIGQKLNILSTKYRKYLFIIEPVQVDGISVIPRHLLHAVLEPQILARPGEQDLVIIRIIARGLKDGQEQETVVDLFDFYDETTGFTSMERTTGWHAAIMAGFMAVDKLHQGEFQSN